MSENQNPLSLSAFFAATERRLTREFPGEWPSFQISLCGEILELQFDTLEHAQNVARSLRGRLLQTRQTPDAVIKYWVDDLSYYFSQQHLSSRWCIQKTEGHLVFVAGSGFEAEDTEHRVFYRCHSRQRKQDPTTHSHCMVDSLFQWGRSRDLLLLHGAAVGVNGTGVLIAGRGGAGKSTLSVSCLLSGMDFVGDDYIMLTETGPMLAMPVYSSICLNRDMASLLNPNMPQLGERKNGKLEFDASAYPLADYLSVKGLILPIISDTPAITPIDAGTAIAKIAYSTTMQMTGIPNPNTIKAIVNRLTGLPAFAFHQCRNTPKNAELLHHFITKEW